MSTDRPPEGAHFRLAGPLEVRRVPSTGSAFRKPGLRGLLTGALIALPIFAHAQEPAADAAAQGKQVYNRNCARCHGYELVNPGTTFDLRFFPPDDKGRFLNSVKTGKNAMPAWGDVFSDPEIETLWAYIMATQPR